MEYVYFFDQFSRKPKLKINGKSRLSNIYISILGIFVILGYLVTGLILSLNVMSKETFYMIENTDSKMFNNFTLDTQIPLSVIVSNMVGVELKDPERIFDLKLKYFQYTPEKENQTANYFVQDIEDTKCTFKKLAGDTDDKYENLFKIYKQMKCYDLKPYNISIYGEDNGGPHSTLVFWINQCVNTTESSNCLPQEELDKHLKEIKLTFNYPNKDIDNKLENPFIDYTEGKTFRFSNTLKTRYIFELNSIEFLSDEGLIFESIATHKSYRIDEYKTIQNLALGSQFYPGTFGNINFFGSGKKRVFQRRYLKIHSIFPYLFGFYHLANLLFKLLVNYFGGGSLDALLFSKIIEKEELEKFKEINNPLDYEDLFTKIPNEVIIESGNVVENLNAENASDDESRKKIEMNSNTPNNQIEDGEINPKNKLKKKTSRKKTPK